MKAFASAVLALTLALSGAVTAQPVRKSNSDPRVAVLYLLQPDQYVPDDLGYVETWPLLKEEDIQFGRRVWRTMDIRTDSNRHLWDAANSGATLASLFVGEGMNGRIKIYAGTDPNFTFALQTDSLTRLLNEEQKGVFTKFDAAAATRYLIKEDWFYSAADKHFVARIIGIAPLRTVNRPGQPAKDEAIFWVYYPGSRQQLREHPITMKTDSRVQNLDQLFELRKFESTINRASAFRTHYCFQSRRFSGGAPYDVTCPHRVVGRDQ